MTTIFISGSREIPFLPEEVKCRIDRIIDRGFDIVIGDSEKGVDSKVIGYLSSCEYPRVTVYTIHDRPRAKGALESWDVRKITPVAERKVNADGSTRNARELETAKDVAMGDTADFGLVIWKSSSPNRFGKESASKGSLRNMHQLLADGKPVVLFMYEDSSQSDIEFSNLELRTIDDLERVIAECNEVVKSAYEAIVRQSRKETTAQEALFD